MDFAEETLKLEHLAVRFKLEESVQEYKRIFEQCKADIAEKGSPIKQDPSKAEVNFHDTKIILVDIHITTFNI